MAARKQANAPVDPEAVAQTAAEVGAQALADFGFAVNAEKLNRAKAYVQETKPELKPNSKAFSDAVRERYVEIKGLLRENTLKRMTGKPRGVEVNTADNNGDVD